MSPIDAVQIPLARIRNSLHLRHAVRAGLAGLGITGLAVVLFQLARSLPLSDHASADALTLELRDLALGAYRSFDGQNSRLYVVRMPLDEIWAFTVPLRAAKVAMPDVHWGSSAFDCTDFRPGAQLGPLTPDSVFQCHDADLPTWGIYQWRWRLDGKSAAQFSHTSMDNLPQVTVERSGSVIRVSRWDVQWGKQRELRSQMD
jgi:hypothetical protein